MKQTMESQLTFWQAVVLAAIQGITEFIPVSSSGHLVLVRTLFGWSGEAGLAFDTVLHGGSLAALLIYFRREWTAIGMSFLKPAGPRRQCPEAGGHARPPDFPPQADPPVESVSHRRLLWMLVVATLPVVIAGPILKPLVESESVIRSSAVTGLCMIMTALLFWLSDLGFSPRNKPISFLHALVIGCAQIVALLPGASRAGWTIGTGVLCGQSRESSVRFSFLMAIPVIAGAIVFQMKDIMNMSNMGIEPFLIALGFIVSFLVSLGAIHFCVNYFRAHSLRIFAVYLAVVGLLAVLL